MRGRLKPVEELVIPRAMSPAERDELWAFFSPIVSRPREQFEHAFEAFPDVRYWRHPRSGALLGFSAARWLVVDVDERPVDVLFFGWAAVAPELRGRGLPFRDGFVRFLRQALRRPRRKGYLVFASSTFKSYKALVRYGPACWPQPGRPMPSDVSRAVAAVMAALGESSYDPEAGVLKRFGAQRYQEGVYADAPEALADPLIAYYAARNPGQHEGDTLLVAYELTLRNMLTWGVRVLSPWRRR